MWVVGVVRHAVVGHAANPLVNGQHSLDGGVGILLGAVGRGTDKVGRLANSTERVVLITRMLGDAGHRVRVQHFEEERRQSPDHHGREVAIDHSGDSIDG